MVSINDLIISRRTLLLGGLMAGVSPLLLSGCVSNGTSNGAGVDSGTLNWLTWSDHFSNEQLAQIAAQTKITGRPKLFSDNADALLQLKQTGSQFDIVSADALWVKKYRESGLIDAFQLDEIAASKEL